MPIAVRLTKAHIELGIGRDTFNDKIRPLLNVYKMGDATKLVDYKELCRCWEDYKMGLETCKKEHTERRVSSGAVQAGTFTKSGSGKKSVNLAGRIAQLKPKNT